MDTLEDYLFKRNSRYAIWTTFAIVVALLIFHAGVIFGERDARGMDDHGPQMGPFGALPHSYMESGHGAVGEIESYAPPILIVETRGESTTSITVASTTLIDPSGATSTTLVPGAHVIIIGTPIQGGMTAKLIRVVPPPPQQ